LADFDRSCQEFSYNNKNVQLHLVSTTFTLAAGLDKSVALINI